jgi:hypothetical protein
MNIETIATAAAALLGPYLAQAGQAFAKKAGEQLVSTIGALYSAIKSRFKGDAHAEQTLTRLEQDPGSGRRQAALEDVLMEKMEQDPEFAEKIRQLIEDSEQAGGGDIIKQRLSVSGKAGNIIQVGKMEGGAIQGGGD